MSILSKYSLEELLDYSRVGSWSWDNQFSEVAQSYDYTDRPIEKKMRDLKVRYMNERENIVKNINHYIDDGFVKVCTVAPGYNSNYWHYKNINKDYLYCNHRSWIYFIVNDETVVKVGESGNPLGIKMATRDQPVGNSTNRFGRLAQATSSTDANIKHYLYNSVQEGHVSLWAKKCEINKFETKIGGKNRQTLLTFHKELELQYLDYMKDNFYKPSLNAGRK